MVMVLSFQRLSYSLLLLLVAVGWSRLFLTQAQTCDASSVTCAAMAHDNNNNPNNMNEDDDDDKVCRDDHDACSTWAAQGRNCTNLVMLKDCRKSCFMCDNVLLDKYYRSPWDTKAQYIPPPGDAQQQQHQQTLQHWHKVKDYMIHVVYTQEAYQPVRHSKCRNLHKNCIHRAATTNDCNNDPNTILYMNVVCAPACLRCDNFLPQKAINQWDTARDVDETFERLLSLDQYNPIAHRRPQRTISSSLATNSDNDNNDNEQQDGPWIVTLENFLTAHEAETLMALGHAKGFQPSRLAHEKSRDTTTGFVTQHRTSSNAFCDGDCYKHTVTQTILQRIQNATGLPVQNSEDLQLVRYEPGQYYGVHHDCGRGAQATAEGHRIVTFFLYLNDVAAGGETSFPNANLTVTPVLGKAVVWQNVLSDNLNEQDDRTFHEALPVKEGIKYGANAWIHQRDYQGPFARGCMAVYQP